MVEVLGAQTPLAIFHCSTVVPVFSPVIPVKGKVGLITEPPPERTDQVPMPTAGALPLIAMLGLLMQMVWEGPASDGVGRSSAWTMVVDVRTGHTPFWIDQANVLAPKTRLVTDVVADTGETMVAEPPISDQEPAPDKGALPFNCAVGVLIHTVWLAPATGIVARLSTWMLSVEVLAAQAPFKILHCSTLVPEAKPVMPVNGKAGVTMVPLPESTDHVPMPTVGKLPFNAVVGSLMQSVCEAPARAGVGRSST
jgi:hypothetical protein